MLSASPARYTSAILVKTKLRVSLGLWTFPLFFLTTIIVTRCRLTIFCFGTLLDSSCNSTTKTVFIHPRSSALAFCVLPLRTAASRLCSRPSELRESCCISGLSLGWFVCFLRKS
ncbi:hypothetical protein V5799_023129 [Amblyomma americanum]|uniref:Uncharacterized protein n=1 Tax=Amblyomma americanum TaxID=6943 RepID=A0AAQ4FIW4_AMBAM